jgi:hypothetical protein
MKRRPIRKWIVRSLLVSFLLFLLFLGKLYWDWRSTRRAGEEHLARVMNELDESEPAWRDVFETRNQRLAPAERNSAEKALVVLQSLPRDFHNWCNQFNPTEELEPNQLIPDDRITELKEKIKPHSAAIEKLKELIQTEPNSGFKLILDDDNPLNTILEDRQQFRRAAQLLMFDGFIHLGANKPDEAIRSCRAILGASRAIGDDPGLICQLVRMAITAIAISQLERILGQGEAKLEVGNLQRELNEQVHVNFNEIALKGDRIIMDELFIRLDQMSVDLRNIERKRTPDESEFSMDRILWRNYRRYVPAQRAIQLELFRDFIGLSISETPQRLDSMEVIVDRIRGMTGYDKILINKLFPGVQRTMEAEVRIKAQLSCAVIALACERFRQTNGRWPNTIAEIPKSILAEVPNDPFTGEPLMMTRTELGLNIYSTGKDGIDDGGEVLDPKMELGTDIGFRLYDPAHRRKPAPVKEQVDDEGFPKP